MSDIYKVIPDTPAGPLGEFPVELDQLLAEVRRHLELSPGSPFRLPDVPRVSCAPKPPPPLPRTHGPPRERERPPILGPATAIGIKKGLRSLPAIVTPIEASSTSESRTVHSNGSTTSAARKLPLAPTARKPDHLYSFRRNPDGLSDGELWSEICALRAAPSNGESLAKRINDRWELGGYHANQLCARFDLFRDEREVRPPTSTLAVIEDCPEAAGCIRDQKCKGFKNCRNGLQHIEKPQSLPALPPLPAHDSDDIGPDNAS